MFARVRCTRKFT
uniref:Uncharacterized protein n=1 Tax=Arundo donax TaxID=35708 RepID=A0A0A9BAB2_ARUDO